MLRDRIAACESSDALATKDLVEVEPGKLKKLLQLTQEVWPHFTFEVKVKVLENRIHRTLLANVVTAAGAKGFNGLEEALEKLGEAFSFKDVEVGTSGTSFFQVWTPSFQQVIQDFLTSLKLKLEDLGLQPKGGLAAIQNVEDTTFSFDLDSVPKAGAASLHPDLEGLLAVAQELPIHGVNPMSFILCVISRVTWSLRR